MVDTFQNITLELEEKNQSFHPEVVLIGNGVLANKLIYHLKNMNIKINRVKSFHSLLSSGKKIVNQNPVMKNRDVSETSTSSFSSSWKITCANLI